VGGRAPAGGQSTRARRGRPRRGARGADCGSRASASRTSLGYLDGGLAAWDADGRPTRTFENLSPLELSERLGGFGAPIVLDVRKPGEYEDGHLPGALLRPLDPRISARDLPANAALAIVCRSGYRSASAASLLAASHAGPILNLAGGTDAWRESGLPLEKGSAALPG
jgi:rhodanese-related sulfurtransferase